LGKQLISKSERRGGEASQGIPHFSGNIKITVPFKYPLLTLTVGFVLFKTKYTPIYFNFASLAQTNATFTMEITTHDYYRYKPSFDAAIVVAILYTLAFMGTILQFLRYRSWVWTVMVFASGSEFPLRPKYSRSLLTNISGGSWVYYKVYISQER
jgi:hypothetical protein